jgi:hypothetical protein
LPEKAAIEAASPKFGVGFLKFFAIVSS